MNTGFAITTGTQFANIDVSPFGAGLPVEQRDGQHNIAMAGIGSTAAGNGVLFFGATVNSAYSGLLTAPASNTYYLGGNATALITLTLSTANALTGTGANVVVGSPLSNPVGGSAVVAGPD